MSETFEVSNQLSGKRLDVTVAELFDISRNLASKHIKEGRVVNKSKIKRNNLFASTTVIEGDIITLSIPIKKEHKGAKPAIVLETDDVVVLNKPAGMLSHSKTNTDDEYTVTDWLVENWTENSTLERFGLAHRLDRQTSGLLIAAKNKETYDDLKDLFKNRKVEKHYLAIVEGSLKNEKTELKLPITRKNNHSGKFMVSSNGKSASTKIKMSLIDKSGKFSLVELLPKTGRTHQLRVHLNYLGYPIYGDRLYGSKHKAENRIMLHAKSLIIPALNIDIDSDIPGDMQTLIVKLGIDYGK